MIFLFLYIFLLNISLENTHSFTLESYEFPKSVYISPDNKRVYVCNLKGQNILIINRETKEIIDKVNSPGKPVEIAFTAGGRYVWISLLKKASIIIYDASLKRIVKKIPVGREPKILRATPDEKYVFVSNWGSKNVSVIDTEKM